MAMEFTNALKMALVSVKLACFIVRTAPTTLSNLPTAAMLLVHVVSGKVTKVVTGCRG